MINKYNHLLGKTVIKKHGYNHICRGVIGNIGLHELSKGNIPFGYEVVLYRTPSGIYTNPLGVRLPSNEEFGKYGWSYRTIEKSIDKIMKLINEQGVDVVKDNI